MAVEIITHKNGTCDIMGLDYDAKGRESASGKSMLKVSEKVNPVVNGKSHVLQVNLYEKI